ncbi:PKD domain-containing protein [bacterium]|nr:PKD domain-containing protein [bacterium]
MRNGLIFLLTLSVASAAWAAPPSASLSATFAPSAKAPLLVYFDASASTDPDTSQPIHDLIYCFESGEPNQAMYDNTTHKSTPKARFCGAPSYAYVYESPGTYAARVTVIDEDDNRDTATVQITVQSFSASNTRCVNPVGDPNFNGCPSGADQANNNDFDAAAEGAVAAGYERILFKGGASYAFDSTVNLDGSANGGVHLGSYGSGRYTLTGNADPVFDFVDDVRIEDFSWSGNLGSMVFDGDKGSTSDANNVLIRNVSVSASRIVLSMEANMQSGSALPENIGFFESTFTDCGNSGGGNNCMFTSVRKMSIVDTIMIDSTDAEHVHRMQHAQECFVHNSKYGKAHSNKHSLTLRGLPSTGRIGGITTAIPEKCFISDSHFVGNTSWVIESGSINAPDDSGNVQHRDHIYERNYFTADPSSQPVQCMLKLGIGKQTVRNNLFDLRNTKSTDGRGNAMCSAAAGTEAYNNAVYSDNATSRAFWAKGKSTCSAKNNVFWSDTGSSYFFIDSACSTSADNWDSDGNGLGLDGTVGDLSGCPFASCPPNSPADFAIREPDTDGLLDSGSAVPNLTNYNQRLRPADAGFDVGAFEANALGFTTPPAPPILLP